ncbi:MAG: acyltransferase [Akkermansia sp.]|nr:acyltransferase [Akkermansia sp.]
MELDKHIVLMPMPSSASQQRYHGIDLLRIVAMIMICIIHVNYFIVFPCKADVPVALTNFSLWLEGVGIIGVNLYALTTGYVCVNVQWKLARILRIWGLVFFYAFSIGLLAYALSAFGFISWSLSLYDCAKTFLREVLTFRSYWYVSAYVGLFFVVPFLNVAIKVLDKRQLKQVLIVLLGIFPILNIVWGRYLYGSGSDFVWLAVMYIAGAYVRLYLDRPSIFGKDAETPSGSGSVCSKFFSTPILLLISLLCSFQFVLLQSFPCGKYWSNSWPVNVFYALAVFVIFARWNVRSGKLVAFIKWAAPATFSVYLIHLHPYIHRLFVDGGDMWLQKFGGPIWFSLAYGLLVYLFCTIVDRFRMAAFKFCRVEQFWNIAGSWLERCAARLLAPFLKG